MEESDAIGLPSLGKIFQTAAATFGRHAPLLWSVFGIQAGTALALWALTANFSASHAFGFGERPLDASDTSLLQIIRFLAGTYTFTACLVVAGITLAGTRAALDDIFHIAWTRLRSQITTSVLAASIAFILYIVIAVCLGPAFTTLQRLSQFPTADGSMTVLLLWLAIIAASGLLVVPAAFVAACALIDTGIDGTRSFRSVANAWTLLKSPETRGFALACGIGVCAFALLGFGVESLARLFAAAFDVRGISFVLATIAAIPINILIYLVAVTVHRALSERDTASLRPSPQQLLRYYVALCVAVYLIVHPHYGQVWLIRSFAEPPTAPPQSSSAYDSLFNCESDRRKLLPEARPPSSVSFCAPESRPIFGWI